MNQAHIPRKYAKFRKTMIKNAQGYQINAAISKEKRQLEEEKQAIQLNRESALRMFLANNIKSRINQMKQAGMTDMFEIVKILTNADIIEEVIAYVNCMVKDADNNESCKMKINPTNMDLRKSIEYLYNRYLIEQLLRYQIKEMQRLNYSTNDIVNILTLSGGSDFKKRGKEVRLKVRSVLGILYNAEEKEQRIDKLREETRSIMKALANEIRQQENQNQNLVKIDITQNPIGVNPNDPDASNR